MVKVLKNQSLKKCSKVTLKNCWPLNQKSPQFQTEDRMQTLRLYDSCNCDDLSLLTLFCYFLYDKFLSVVAYLHFTTSLIESIIWWSFLILHLNVYKSFQIHSKQIIIIIINLVKWIFLGHLFLTENYFQENELCQMWALSLAITMCTPKNMPNTIR